MNRFDSRRLKSAFTCFAFAAAGALSTTAFAAAPASAAPGGPASRPGAMPMQARPMANHDMGPVGIPAFGGPHLDRMLEMVNATEAQRTQIQQIAKAAADDMKTLHEASSKLREESMDAFTAPELDAAAIEKQRQLMTAQNEQMSKRMTQAMLDIARVLTPEQRATLAKNAKERRAQMQAHREGFMREHMQGRMQGHMQGAGPGASHVPPASAATKK